MAGDGEGACEGGSGGASAAGPVCAWDAADHARNSSAQTAWARELIPRLRLRGDETLLDIGCGDGTVTALLAERLPRGRAVGIDASEGMLSAAGRWLGLPGRTNLEFCRMDAARLEFTAEFDVAFSNAALHWVPDQGAVLRGVSRALRRPGRLLFQLGGKGNAREIVAAFDRLVTREEWRPFFEGFAFPYAFPDPAAYEALLREAGLRPVRVELVPREMRQEGRAGLAGWLRTTWMPWTGRVPEPLRDRFIEEALDGYLSAHPPGRDGAVSVAMVRLEAEAEAVRFSYS